MAASGKKINRFPKLLLGFFSMLFAGIIYAWSILKAPLALEFGWTASQLALNFTLTMCFFCIGGIIAGFLIRYMKLRLIVMLSGALAAAGFILTSFNTGSLSALYLTYGLMCGLGVGMAYNAIIASTNAWYPDKKGTSSGTLMMGFGLSSLVFGNLANIMIGMENVGWRTTYVLIGIAIGVVFVLASLLISVPGADVIFPEGKKKGDNKTENERNYTVKEAIRRPSFWKFFIFILLLTAVGNSVISFAKDLSLAVGAWDSLAATLVGILAVCNGFGRIMSGLLFDNIGRNRTMLLANMINVFVPAVLLVAMIMTSLPLGILGLCLAGIGYGFCPTISSAFVMDFYGKKYFNLNFSVANTMLIPASFISTLSNYLVQSSGSYLSTFIMLLCCGMVALVIGLSIKHP